MDTTAPNIETVREMCTKYSNWGRWGEDDQAGTLNFATAERIAAAAELITSGKAFSLSIPFDDKGPQTGGFGRFNPIHLMIRDGADVVANTTVRDFYGGVDRHIRGTDDMVIMCLHGATHWDALAHIMHEGRMYNGYPADLVSSRGALKNDIARVRDRVAGRGVLLDVPRFKRKPWLEAGDAITGADLEACARAQGVEVGPGDFLLIRTGQLTEVRHREKWADYAGGPAPGLGLESVAWVHEKQVAAIATDTWGAEVLPNQTRDVFQPLHIIMIVYMGLTIGEMFDLDALADDCAADGRYQFFFTAAPLRITGGVGSPINPIAIK